MAKKTQVTQKSFAGSAGPTEIGKFGSLAAGLIEYTSSPADVQSLSNFLDGWYGAVLGNNSPAIQDMNALFFLLFYQFQVSQQNGVWEWASDVTYYTGGFVNSAGVLYVSLADDNLNNAVTDVTKWQRYDAEVTGAGKDFWGVTLPSGYVWANATTIGNASSNATGRANADARLLFDLLWTAGTDATLPIFTSAGAGSTRGASAAADWAANTAIATPDKRGRVSAGLDNLGGASAASRLTGTTMTPNGTTVGGVGGTQTHQLTVAEMPTHSHAQAAHTHGFSMYSGTGSGGPPPATSYFAASDSGGAGILRNLVDVTNSVSVQASAPGIDNTGGDGAHLNVQPTIACNYIIKL
jgi:microcystin-dependent protein